MSSRSLTHLQSVFTPSAVGELARLVNEHANATQKAVTGLLSALVAGVANRVQTDGGATQLYQLLTQRSFATDPSLDQLVDTDTHRQRAIRSGRSLLADLFADQSDQLATVTAQYSGIQSASAATLSGLIMSVLIGFLHRQLTTQNLTQPQLVTLLGEEADPARAAIPVALAGALGWWLGTEAPAVMTTSAGRESLRSIPVESRTSGAPWWRWLLYLLVPLLLLLLLLRTCRSDEAEPAITASTSQPMVATDTVASDLDGNELALPQDDAADSSTAAPAPEVRVGVDLPGGRQLKLVEHSFTYSLAKFLATKQGKTPKVFTFDNLTFETNSAQITAKARSNVDDLIQIMQAYPGLAIRIEGNTDSTGPDAVNDPLSAQRALSVKAALVQAGIDAGRIQTRELGDTKPVASNQTQAGRQRNRRIDVVVTKL